MKDAILERWESACGRVRLFRGDAYQMVPSIQADALISDPPYGINFQHSGKSSKSAKWHRVNRRKIIGDNKPFNALPFVNFPFVALFGAEHFANQLKRGHLLSWDKRGTPPRGPKNNFIDAEFVWLNKRASRNAVTHLWKGVCRDMAEEDKFGNKKRWHVSQKPVRVLRHLIEVAQLKPDSLIIDPFMGSGSTAIAAMKSGHRFVGIDKSKVHFKTAKARVLAFLEEAAP